MPRLKKVVNLLALVLTTAALGTASGISIQAAFAQQQVVVGAGCENDECEGGTQCKDNPGGNTGCAYEGSGCKTSGCAASQS